MTRSALQRLIRRIALASLPIVGQACGHEAPPPGDAFVTTDAAAPNDQAAPLDMTNPCGQAPTKGGCLWYAFVDAAPPEDAMSSNHWTRDAGADRCAPCRFSERNDIWCGDCLVVAKSLCGPTFVCSVYDCNNQCLCSGRRPSGLIVTDARDPESGGARLARMAHLEAASVPAFARLAVELEAHGAPERLIAGARRALLDEECHARMMSDLARAAGARVPVLDVEPMTVRSLEEIALENAIEGCVRESLSAIMAAHQACGTTDAIISKVFRHIAVDESRHANLAWAIDEWARVRLRPAYYDRIQAARLAELRVVLAPRVARPA